MSSFKIFIVEDDAMYGEILKYHLSLNPDYRITLYKLGNELLDNLYTKARPDLLFSALQHPRNFFVQFGTVRFVNRPF